MRSFPFLSVCALGPVLGLLLGPVLGPSSAFAKRSSAAKQPAPTAKQESEPAAPGGYEELKKSEFFSFFNLSETKRVPAANGDTQVWLKTGGFQQFIDIQITVDKAQQVRDAVLQMDRSWVGDKTRLSPFAKDIAKSFIAALVSDVDKKQAKFFIDGIWNLRGSSDRVISLREEEGSASPLPPDVKKALEVYSGSERRSKVPMQATDLLLENVSTDGRDRLHITIRRLPGKPGASAAAAEAPKETPAAKEDAQNQGADPAATLRLNMALTGKPYLAIINKELKSPKDDLLKAKMVVGPEDILMTLQLAINFQENQATQFHVHDGSTGHALVAFRNGPSIDTLVYLDPWPQGSFLEKGNNQAGVAAVPAPEKRYWVVKTEELKKVLYAIYLELDYLKQIAEFCTLVSQDEAQALSEYRKRMEQDAKSYSDSEARLDRLGQVFLAQGMLPRALVTFKINKELHPQSAAAHLRIGTAYEAKKDAAQAAVYYQKAVELLEKDASLQESDKQTVKESATQGLSRVRTPR